MFTRAYWSVRNLQCILAMYPAACKTMECLFFSNLKAHDRFCSCSVVVISLVSFFLRWQFYPRAKGPTSLSWNYSEITTTQIPCYCVCTALPNLPRAGHWRHSDGQRGALPPEGCRRGAGADAAAAAQRQRIPAPSDLSLCTRTGGKDAWGPQGAGIG